MGPRLTTPDPNRHLRIDHLVATIGRRAVRGGVVMVVAQSVKIAGQFAGIAILARLLPPRAFGLIAMVAAVYTCFDYIKELGLSAATIRKNDISHEQVTALFWINVGAGTIIAATLFFLAPMVARFYDEPDLVGVTRVLALVFLLNGLTVQHWALLRRQMRFVATATLATAGDLAALVAAVAVALAGGGYWALVAQRLVPPVLALIGSWTLCPWRPGRPGRAQGLRDLLGFGGAFTVAGVAVAFSRSIDQILIGWLWGPSSLGYYERASKVAITPVDTFNQSLYAVAMPALSRIVHESERYRQGFTAMIEKTAMIVLPGGLLVASCANVVVATLFGRGWGPAAPLVTFFALAASSLPLATASYLLPATQNRPRDLMFASIVDSGLCLALIFVGLPFGVPAVAASYGAGAFLVRAPVTFWLVTRRGAVSASDLWHAIGPSLFAGALVAVAVRLLDMVWSPSTISPTAHLAVLGIAGAVVALTAFAIVPRSRRSLIASLTPVMSFVGARPEAMAEHPDGS